MTTIDTPSWDMDAQCAELRAHALAHLAERGQKPSPAHWDQWHEFLDIDPDLRGRDYRPLTAWAFDGMTFDLTHAWIDVYGCRWEWTGLLTEAGAPLMQHGTDTPLPLDEVYLTYGPLIPAPRTPTHTEIRAVLTAPTSTTVHQIVAEPQPAARAAVPVPAITPASAISSPAEPTDTATPTPTTFARLLRRLRGAR